MNKSYPTILEAIKLIIIMIVLFFILYIPIIIIDNLLNTFLQSNSYINIVISILSELITIFYAYKHSRISIKNDLFSNHCSYFLLVSVIIFSIGFNIIISQIIDIIQFLFFKSSIINSSQDTFPTILSAILVAPLLEEILFRGLILKGFLKNYSTTISIIFSSLLFSVLHMDVIAIISSFVGGIFFSYIYIKTHSIIPCILAHFLHNSMGYILTFIFNLQIQGYNSITSSSQYQPLWFNIIGITFLIIGFLIFSKSHLIRNKSS